MKFLGPLMVAVPLVLVATALFVLKGHFDERLIQSRLRTEAQVEAIGERLDSIEVLVAEFGGGAGRDVARGAFRRGSSRGDSMSTAESAEPLQERLERIEAALDEEPGPYGAVDEAEFAAAQEWFGTEQREQIREVLEDIRAEEKRLQEERRRQVERDLIARRVDGMVEDLNLSPQQSEQMVDVLLEESVARRTLFAELRDGEGERGGDRNLIFEAMRETREVRNEELKEVLDPWQFEEYQRVESEDRRGGRRGRGRGGDGEADGGEGGRRNRRGRTSG